MEEAFEHVLGGYTKESLKKGWTIKRDEIDHSIHGELVGVLLWNLN